jgi:hypothetical protein
MVRSLYERENYLMSRAGYSLDDGEYSCVLFGRLDPTGRKDIANDPYDWGNQDRTYKVAHDYIQKNWGKLMSGQVIDVEYILNETDLPKKSEQFTSPD